MNIKHVQNQRALLSCLLCSLHASATPINKGNVPITLHLADVVILSAARDAQWPLADPSSLSAQFGLEEDTLMVAADTRRF
jgi:hypothetical protein